MRRPTVCTQQFTDVYDHLHTVLPTDAPNHGDIMGWPIISPPGFGTQLVFRLELLGNTPITSPMLSFN